MSLKISQNYETANEYIDEEFYINLVKVQFKNTLSHKSHNHLKQLIF